MVRVPVLDRREDEPGSVVLKWFTDEKVSEDCCLREWSGARFLSGLPTRFGPGALGGDPQLRLVVLDDLGTHPSLADRLLGDDPDAAETALLDVFTALGRLNGATAGREDELDDVRGESRERLGEPLQPDEVRAAPAEVAEHVGRSEPPGDPAPGDRP